MYIADAIQDKKSLEVINIEHNSYDKRRYCGLGSSQIERFRSFLKKNLGLIGFKKMNYSYNTCYIKPGYNKPIK